MEIIEDIVRSHVPFMHGVTSKGWHRVYCEVCGDGSRTKGPRGGWNFIDTACFYHCFNCGVDGSYDPTREHPMSKDMYNVFQSFGIPPNEYKILELRHNPERKKIQKKRVTLPKIDAPDYFKALDSFESDDKYANRARTFLWDKYRITDKDYTFYLSTGKTSSISKEEQYWCKYLRKRIIIPAIYKNKMIYWQARIFVGDDTKKYVTAQVPNSYAVMYGMDNIYTSHDKPLYVTEGFFDSWHLGGVAIMSNTMNHAKLEILSRLTRPKIVVPDYNEDGFNLALQAVSEGWGIALPDIHPATDISQAIAMFGKLYVLKSIVKNTHFRYKGEVMLRLNYSKFKK